MKISYRCLLALLIITIAACLGGADTELFAKDGHPLGLNENQSYGILGDSYVTPHVKWARPFAGGKIKALVMAPEWSQRETVELAQRLSLDYTPWMTSAFSRVAVPGEWYWMPTPAALIDKLLSDYLADDYEVIVIGKLEWSALPARQRFQLLKKVSEGTGLVYIEPPVSNKELDLVFKYKPAVEGTAYITEGIPFSFLPQLKGIPTEKIARAGIFGKGRVVVLDYGQKLPQELRPDGQFRTASAYPALTPQWDLSDSKSGYTAPDDCPEIELVPYEYYQALVARAVIWASGKPVETRLGDISVPSVVNYPPSSAKVNIKAVSAPVGALVKASVRSRSEYERVYRLPSQPADGRELVLPDMPAGDYILDVWLTDAAGKIFDWRSKGFIVKSDIDISCITLSGRNYDPGSRVSGEIRLSRALRAGEFLATELWDNYDRLIARESIQANGDTASFSFLIDQPLTIMHRIVAKVSGSGSDAAVGRLSFPVRAGLRRDDFKEVSWCSGENQFLTHLMLNKLGRDDQADAVYIPWRGVTAARNIAAANLEAVPYTARFGVWGSKEISAGKYGYGCMSNPVTLAQIDEWGRVQSDIYGPYGPLAWSHGDETNYSTHPDTCWSDTCLADFRGYLKAVYPDITALNGEWKTNYHSWEDVVPLTYADAVKTGNYAPWIEHRLAAQRVFARFYKRTTQALSVNDPGARAGFDGPLGFAMPNSGVNWWLLKDYVDIMHSYMGNSEEMEIVRSFADSRHLTGLWYGTYGLTWQLGPNTVAYHHFFPWYTLFHGMNSTWFYTMGAPGIYTGYAPDLTNMPFMQASRDSLASIKAGKGRLLLASELQDDRIAMHYSDGSRIADSIFYGLAKVSEAGVSLGERPIGNAWKESLADFNKALEHSGLQYRYLAYEEVEKDALIKRGYKVFIMPHSHMVSQAEAEAIRRFVKGGGLLIADILPGALNEHGTKQQASMLADLFPSQEAGRVNRVGKGKTVILGEKLSGYGYASFTNMAGWKKLEKRHMILAELLESEAGIRPQVGVDHKGEGEMPPVEVFRFCSAGDKAEYVGLLRDYFMYDEKSYPAAVRFPRKSHLYDMTAGKYLGLTDSISIDLSYKACLFALLPYRVASLSVSTDNSVEAGGSSVLSIRVNPDGRREAELHMLRVEIVSPSGERLSWYTGNIPAERGSANYTVKWALNEKPGKYTVKVRDVASGVVSEKIILLR